MKNIIEKYPLVILTIVSIGLFAFNLGELKVSIMEARNFIVAREMLTEGHWLLTTMNDIARYEKPPFPAWFTTPFVYIFGTDNVWAYRIPTSIYSILGVVFFYKLVKIWLSKDIAFYTAMVLATSFYFIAIRFEAPSDIYTHVNIIIGVFFLVRHHPNFRFNDILMGGLFFGLSVLSKGPVGPYALFLPFILAYFFSFDVNLKAQILKTFGFLVVGVLVGGSWYLYVRYADPQVLIEIADKETDNWTSYNTRPFYYYWSFFIQSGIWTIPAFLSLIYPYFVKRIKHQRLYKFSFLWTMLALILLSVIPEKKPRYLVPVLFPLALNTVLVFDFLIKNKQDKLSKFFHYLHYPIIILVCTGIIIFPFVLGINWFDIGFVHVLMCISAIGIILLTVQFLKQKRFKALLWSNFLLILTITILGQSLVDVLKKNEDYRSLKTIQAEQIDYESYHVGNLAPEVIWAYGKISTKLKPDLKLKRPYKVLVSKPDLKNFKEKYPEIVQNTKTNIFDENYFRTGNRKRDRFIIYLFEIE